MTIDELLWELEEIKIELDNYYFNEFPLDHPYHKRRREALKNQNTAKKLIERIKQEGIK